MAETSQELRRLADVCVRIGETQLNLPVPLTPEEHFDLKRAGQADRLEECLDIVRKALPFPPRDLMETLDALRLGEKKGGSHE